MLKKFHDFYFKIIPIINIELNNNDLTFIINDNYQCIDSLNHLSISYHFYTFLFLRWSWIL